ncbi:MAG: ABC transporter permease, partial [Actinomycetota bacterium]
FFTELDHQRRLYLGSGASIIVLILVGLVVAPQLIAAEREAGTYDFSWSLPIPRSATVVAWLATNVVVSVPAAAAALWVAAWRLDLSLSPGWVLLPAGLLVLVSGTLIGYAVGHAIPNPNITQVVAQVLAFGILGFTPVTYPLENLPAWLGSLHEVLPFYHMGVVMRHGLSEGTMTATATSYGVLAAWTLGLVGMTAWVVGRRR